ncbi:MAG: hypothetical protein ACYSTS_19760 [Planctomycetota bacterium]|jgi:hypothetical protein
MGKDKARDMEIYEETGYGRVQELEERFQELEEIVRDLLTNQI